MMLDAVAAAALGIWLYLTFGRGSFWLEFLRKSPPAGPLARHPSIVAVIPARNEAPFVGKAIESLCNQNYPGDFHIVLVDDGSDDGTADAARAAAPTRILTVIAAPPLPAGWSGKLWAEAAGIRHAATLTPDLLLLTDADIVHGPGALEELAARVDSGYGLASHMATLHCRSAAECVLVPAFVFFFFMLYPPAWIRDPRRKTAGAAGGCMMIRREVLEKSGGIEAIRGALIDDCALARQVKSHGASVWLSTSAGTRSIRPYESFGELGRMVSRTAFTQLQHSPWLLAGTVIGMALTYLAPPALALFGSVRGAGLASLAWLLMSVCYFPALRFYGRSPLWAPLLPLVSLFFVGATLHSALAYWSGAGGQWKGRVQDSRS
ncbi:MAG TPA: glycosyltransferase [Candidatus Sulfopaludibacter sp.]|jgi:hopene-associated glycosyltransferase HpnB|nr:glycosyltransferase [Candidatus Sulfopaludibacter sp.]